MAAYGADEFPAFFTRRSGCRAPMRIDSAEEGAALIRAALQLNLSSGIVIGARHTVHNNSAHFSACCFLVHHPRLEHTGTVT